MKFTIVALLAALATPSFAQTIVIGFPANGTSVTRGSNIIVEVDRPDSLTGSVEIAVVIGIRSCGSTASDCLPPGEALGTILFNGPYNPQFNTPPDSKPPHQNFTVTIPQELAQTPGPAELSVFHVSLVGASPQPLAETKAIVLDVV